MKTVFKFIFFIFGFLRVSQGHANSCYEAFHSIPGCPLYSPWLCDPVFLQIDQGYPDPFPTKWRWKPNRYFQYILSRNTLPTQEGDFIECGVFSGKSSDIFASVLDRYDFTGRKLYGFDSFEGFATPNKYDLDIQTNKQYFATGPIDINVDHITKKLSNHQCQIELVKGWIPQCFSGYENKLFCFAHIDVDLYQATYDALSFIYPRTVPGGIILFDDYGFPNCPGAKKAIDEYLCDKQEILISIPTGQAFLIKR